MVAAAFSWAATAALGTLIGAFVAALTLYLAGRRNQAVTRHENRDVAREEALELATIRGEAIADLQQAVLSLRHEVAGERDAHLEAVNRLQRALDLSREQALETQQMLAHGVRALLIWVLGELEKQPPGVELAIKRIREALTDTEPRPPGQRRAT